MRYLNCGAKVNGERPKTKKALREALQNAPETVTFDSTSEWNEWTSNYHRSDITFSIVGPDPYTKRNWYANYCNGKFT